MSHEGPTPIFYVFLTIFIISIVFIFRFLLCWCTNEEKKSYNGTERFPYKMDLDLAWGSKNASGADIEAETSVSSVQATTTLVLQNQDFITESNTKYTLFPLTPNKRHHKSDSSLMGRRTEQLQKPVDIIIYVEDFDEIARGDVSLKGKLDLPVCDEPALDFLEMKPIFDTYHNWKQKTTRLQSFFKNTRLDFYKLFREARSVDLTETRNSFMI